jgi:phosphoesterase RecJ-like protein
MNTDIKENILNKIEEFDSIIIHRHINPDPDALGSQLGLKYILETLFEKKVYVVGEEVKGLDFLGKMDNISDDLFKKSLCFVLDTANEERVSDQRYKDSPCVIKIDHHPDREQFGNISWVDTSFSSTSEMISYFFTFDGDLNIPAEAARILYAGLIGDTGRFQYSNTNSRTLHYASLLLKHSFDPQEIFTNMYKTTLVESKAKGVLLSDFMITENGVAWYHFDEEKMKSLSIDRTQASNLVNTMANIEGVNIWVLFVQDGDSYRVRIRSSKTEINSVANKYNGGGHPLASGATVKNMEESFKLVEDLDKLL